MGEMFLMNRMVGLFGIMDASNWFTSTTFSQQCHNEFQLRMPHYF